MRIVCDIDGVIIDPSEQAQKYLYDNNRFDWDTYFAHTLEMKPIRPIINIIKLLMDSGAEVIFLTGRPESNRDATINQLHLIGLDHFYELIMINSHRYESAADFKLSVCHIARPDIIFEDEPRAVKKFTDAGFKVVQVHGYRHNEQDNNPLIAPTSNSKG